MRFLLVKMRAVESDAPTQQLALVGFSFHAAAGTAAKNGAGFQNGV